MKKHFYWELDEVKSYLAISLIFAFILSFRDWGTNVFEAAIGSINLLTAFIVVLISVILHDLAHRLMAVKMGYKIKYKISWFAALLALLVCFVTNGKIQAFIAGGLIYAILPRQRLGRWRECSR